MKRILLLLSLALFISCSDDNDSGCSLKNASLKTATPFANGCGMAVSKSGRIAVTVYNGGYGQPGQVLIYASYEDFKAGEVQSTLQAIAPEAVVFDSDENLYVAETEAVAGIKVFNSNDYYFLHVKTIQIGFNNPRGLAIDADDRLYVADDGNGRVVRFDTPMTSDDYTASGNIGIGLKGIAISGNTIYTANYNESSVTAYDLIDDAIIGATIGQVSIDGATDISAKGNSIAVTSFATGKLTMLSGCDFSNEKKKDFDAFGSCYGTTFLNGSTLLGAFYNEDVVKELSVK